MLTRRIIACLDVTDGRVVKGVRFEDLADAGDPAELAHRHAQNGADEIVFLDITATHEGRSTLLDAVRRTAQHLFIPFTVGGGVRTVEDADSLFRAGADKVTLNSAALAEPELITAIANRYGSQAVIVAIDVRGSDVYSHGGRRDAGRNAIEWAREAQSRGGGEILLTSMDADGTRNGFACTLTSAVSTAVAIPVIASGGAGSVEHFLEVFEAGHADAALAAGIFHYDATTPRAIKQQLAARGIPVRLPC